MFKPKQLFIIIYVNVCVKHVYPHKTRNNILFHHGKNSWKSIVRPMIEFCHDHRICHQLNIYGINSVDVFTTVQIHRKHYRGCVTRLCTSGTTFHKNLSNGSMRRRCEAIVAARGGHIRYWTPQTSILHHNFCLFMICSDNDVETFRWYCLICFAHMKKYWA